MKILLSAVGLIALTAVNGVQAQARVWICEKDGTRFFAETTGCPVGSTFIEAPLQGRVWVCERADGVEFFSENECPSGTTLVRKPAASRAAQSTAPDQSQTQRPSAASTAIQTPAAQSPSDPIAEIVQLSISEGFVRRVEQDQRSISLYVAPKFHEMDFEQKRVAAVAFLEWNKRTHPDSEMVFFFDSRDRERLGHYAFGRLKLDRPRK